MHDKVKHDMDWSSAFFLEQVWPVIKKNLGGGRLLQMEGRPDVELARHLDMVAGIDGWHLSDMGMRGIASRVQKSNKDWATFTVRIKRDNGSKTEFEKRQTSIHNTAQGWVYPAITVQAYAVSEAGPLISCGIAYTKQIIEFIEKGFHEINRTTNAVFAICKWEEMVKHGYKVHILNKGSD